MGLQPHHKLEMIWSHSPFKQSGCTSCFIDFIAMSDSHNHDDQEFFRCKKLDSKPQTNFLDDLLVEGFFIGETVGETVTFPRHQLHPEPSGFGLHFLPSTVQLLYLLSPKISKKETLFQKCQCFMSCCNFFSVPFTFTWKKYVMSMSLVSKFFHFPWGTPCRVDWGVSEAGGNLGDAHGFSGREGIVLGGNLRGPNFPCAT